MNESLNDPVDGRTSIGEAVTTGADATDTDVPPPEGQVVEPAE